MLESSCAEVLLTGLLWINGKTIDLDTRNNTYVNNGSSVYVVPDKVSLYQNKCQGERVIEDNDFKTKQFLINKIDGE